MDVFWPLNHSPIFCSQMQGGSGSEDKSAGEKTLYFPAGLLHLHIKGKIQAVELSFCRRLHTYLQQTGFRSKV